MAQFWEVANADWRTTSPKKGTANANDFTVETDDNEKTTAALKEQHDMEHCHRKAQIKRELARNVIHEEIETVELEMKILDLDVRLNARLSSKPMRPPARTLYVQKANQAVLL